VKDRTAQLFRNLGVSRLTSTLFVVMHTRRKIMRVASNNPKSERFKIFPEAMIFAVLQLSKILSENNVAGLPWTLLLMLST
jgi:hypothetical protein